MDKYRVYKIVVSDSGYIGCVMDKYNGDNLIGCRDKLDGEEGKKTLQRIFDEIVEDEKLT